MTRKPVPLIDFTQTETASSIPARFQRVAERYPSRIALTAEGKVMTYGELKKQVAELRDAILASLGPGKEPVALLLNPTSGTLPAILAVLAAGKSFCALNPYDPPRRQSEILNDLATRLVITDPEHLSMGKVLLQDGIDLLNLEDLPARRAEVQAPAVIDARDIAGIFYSSGSTGKPKGVPRDHATILHRAWLDRNDIDIQPDDRFLQLRQFSFSASLPDAMNALLNGCSIHLYDMRQKGMEDLADTLAARRISVLRPPIELFRHFLASLPSGRTFPDIRCLVMTGDVFYRKDVEQARLHFSANTLLIHHLSSSETGVLCRNKLTLGSPINSEIIPVGLPVEGKQILLLDDRHREVPTGQTGEIAVRTEFRFQEYWNQPDLTAQKIIPDPENPGGKLYLSGDLGRFRPDGQMEFLGRKDNRVKIRGYSVDLNAIETVMMSLDGIRSVVAAAVAGAGGEKRLVGYYSTTDGKPRDPLQMRDRLSRSLPDYMLPGQFIYMDRFPMTESGKVSRQNLPVPEIGAPPAPGNAQPLADQNLERLAGLWKKVLQAERIGPQDDFFSLGGTSLTALRLADEISRSFALPFTPEDVFHIPTLTGQASYLASGQTPGERKCLKLIKSGGSRPAIFCISPTIIDLYTYRRLAEHLDADQPFHALYASRGLALDGSLISIEDEIRRFIQEMREVQPRGPYILAGYSGGGKVAIEMAYHLQEQGEQVSLVIMLDAFAPGYPKLLPWLPPKAYSFLRTLRRIGSYWWKFRILDARGKKDLLLSRENPLGPRFDNWVRNRYREMNRPVKASHLQADDLDRPGKFSHLDGYRGRTFLLRAQKGLLGVKPDPSLGWGRWIQKDLDVVSIPGDHEAILFGPRAEKVARLIQSKINSL